MSRFEVSQEMFELPQLLESPNQRDFGTDGSDRYGKIEFEIGDRPLARRINKEALEQGLVDSAVLDLWDVWLVEVRIGVIQQPRSRSLEHYSVALSFADVSRLSVLGLAPTTDIARLGTARLSAWLNAAFDVSAKTNVPLSPISAEVGVGMSGDIRTDEQQPVAAPRVVAVGEGSSRARWELYRDAATNLHGTQNLRLSLLVRKDAEVRDVDTAFFQNAKLNVQISGTVTGWFGLWVSFVGASEKLSFR